MDLAWEQALVGEEWGSGEDLGGVHWGLVVCLGWTRTEDLRAWSNLHF